VSAVETPPPPTEVERRCPRCGAHLSADQEWCLECGAAVSTRIAEPRGWRASVAVVGALLALALIAVILALVELASDPEQVTEAAATPTPAPTVVPTTTPAPAPTTTPTPPAAGSAPSPGIAEWPEGETAWTVIFNSSGTREDAERIAGELAAKGIGDVGVLDSDDFDSLGPDSFVVFSGQYETRQQAEQALAGVRDRSGGGSTRRIVPKEDADGGSATPDAP
jgi:cell division septation protein DedD